jgi:hypothetical protein
MRLLRQGPCISDDQVADRSYQRLLVCADGNRVDELPLSRPQPDGLLKKNADRAENRNVWGMLLAIADALSDGRDSPSEESISERATSDSFSRLL